MAGAGAAASTLCTTPLEAGCRRPYEAPEPTVSAHQRGDPVGIVFRPVSDTWWRNEMRAMVLGGLCGACEAVPRSAAVAELKEGGGHALRARVKCANLF